MDESDRNNSANGQFVGVRMPHRRDRPRVVENGVSSDECEKYNPSEWVQSLINNVKSEGHKAHSVFSELDVLKEYNGSIEWREAARWVKYEEVVEEGGKRWSKPHVASLSMQTMFNLRKALKEAPVVMDFDCHTLSQVIDKFTDEWVDRNQLDPRFRPHIRDVALKGHKHHHIKRARNQRRGSTTTRPLADIMDESGTNGSAAHLPYSASFASINSDGLGSSNSNNDLQEMGMVESPSQSSLSPNWKPNTNFLRKIPKDSHVANIMVGEVEDLPNRVMGFMRLKEPRILQNDLSEVNIPTRFVFFCLGRRGEEEELIEFGRCVGTMIVDEIFREVAYKARDRDDLLAGFDEFMEQVIVLPPGEWDPKIRLEPPGKVQSQEHRRQSVVSGSPNGAGLPIKKAEEAEEESHVDPSLVMSKIPFKGLVDDIKRKAPFYLSDYKDALHVQCLGSFVYVFLGTLTPNVTFGGLLGQATDQYMGVMECIFAAAVTGILFALFGGQPLNILGSTGPMLVLEAIIYNLCKDNDWDFMPMRFWVGMWTVGIILLIVTFNLSALVKYITRFTEESFATLIAVIFIVEAFKKVIEIGSEYPVNFSPNDPLPSCVCVPRDCNITDLTTTAAVTATTGISTSLPSTAASVVNYTCADLANMTINWASLSNETCAMYGGIMEGPGCGVQYVGDVFFFSILLFIGTFALTLSFVDFKRTTLFPSSVRQRISDFGVLFAIVIMVLVDFFVGINTPKLIVPDEFKPTRRTQWTVNPFSDKNPWWLYLAAAIPALLSTILIFLDQQITAVIVNRKENKLKKGVGYHLDMFVVAICVGIHSFLGLPWYVAATVSALAHINSLKKESECTAPGDKPSFLGVREQRVTALGIGILSGCAVLITSVLKYIPMPVLYGVFFYMGFSALRGMQLVDRLFLFIQPVKYQPDLPYVRHVPLWRIHIFTIIQVLCLAILWVVKTIKVISIGFPMMVLATGVVRKLMECFFAQKELRWLDDLLPGANKKKDTDMNGVSKVPYKSFYASSSTNGSVLDINDKDDSIKPTFFVSDECDASIMHRKSNGTGNTKL
ncbi:electrogenic sodium bicarbonate cotransporter 1-like [Saccostrea echinata]|uniref:electrogenic sodium bicarbonate cotransporter 1-like n=1 Tax=Saccostrea echinata TaxID=191078 RepID=UPI002A7F1429|nr:electrogenic sodium bicarbonate cotransporter 1-like [Saccostrea echinata]